MENGKFAMGMMRGLFLPLLARFLRWLRHSPDERQTQLISFVSSDSTKEFSNFLNALRPTNPGHRPLICQFPGILLEDPALTLSINKASQPTWRYILRETIKPRCRNSSSGRDRNDVSSFISCSGKYLTLVPLAPPPTFRSNFMQDLSESRIFPLRFRKVHRDLAFSCPRLVPFQGLWAWLRVARRVCKDGVRLGWGTATPVEGIHLFQLHAVFSSCQPSISGTDKRYKAETASHCSFKFLW